MFNLISGVGIGLILGWVFLPEPKFVRDFFVRVGLAKSPAATE
jgi:hypothetical protein